MTRKSPYPTRADYPALIENAKPALRELLGAASYERRIAVLNECSLDVVNTVCTIMVLGRHSLYLRRKKPFNAPDAVFVRWAADLWTLREQPAMDLSRDKNAEEMKWSLLEMGAAMQAHGA